MVRRCRDADTSNKCLSRKKAASALSWPTIGSLEAVDCRIHSVRYDMAVNRGAGACCLRWPHQVTYDVVATLIRRTNA
eukprot:scaffold15_cov85-Skeletonema_dohrnii-CCMP3373.AAC.4